VALFTQNRLWPSANFASSPRTAFSISFLHDLFDMSTPNTSKRTVAIVGAGLTGLLAAQGLKQVGSGRSRPVQGVALLTVTRMDSTS
jgi:NADPH-dependent 2,4-dienoyl-CoA reductase/sulfur reductase-like enzyme